MTFSHLQNGCLEDDPFNLGMVSFQVRSVGFKEANPTVQDLGEIVHVTPSYSEKKSSCTALKHTKMVLSRHLLVGVLIF